MLWLSGKYNKEKASKMLEYFLCLLFKNVGVEMRKWKVWDGRKNSIWLDDGTQFSRWAYSKGQLKRFLDQKYITNLEYLEGLELLKEVKNG
jgi:hypothetical protein